MRFISFVFLCLIIVSCAKDNDELNYNCYLKIAKYSSTNKLLFKTESYYLDGKLVNSVIDNMIINNQYDKNGNLIQTSNSGLNTESYFEYNTDNLKVKESFYYSGKLLSVTTYKYLDNKLVSEIKVSEDSNDKQNIYYYYNMNGNLIKVLLNSDSSLYHYSNRNLDSIQFFNKGVNNTTHHYKYKNDSLIYIDFGSINNSISYLYNDLDILIQRITITGSNVIDERFIYDSNNMLIKNEIYDNVGLLKSYLVYIYKENKLIRVDYFNQDAQLISYIIYDKSCE